MLEQSEPDQVPTLRQAGDRPEPARAGGIPSYAAVVPPPLRVWNFLSDMRYAQSGARPERFLQADTTSYPQQSCTGRHR